MSYAIGARILPSTLYSGRASRVMERNFLVQKTTWPAIFTGFFEPVFYLLAFQVGFGKLVSTAIGPNGHAISYVAFVAPALMASSAMNGAIFESTYNIFFKLKYDNVYNAMLATSLGPMDVALGEIGFSLIRGGIYSTFFLVVMWAFGAVTSPWALLMLPVTIIVAFAFSACGMAGITFVRSIQGMDLVDFIVLPMFLLSTTFYSLSVYPRPLQIIVELFPLYHAIEIMRDLAVGFLDWSILGHLSYFLVMIAVGVYIAQKRLVKLLLT
jgi:lipooligosaccharide transport system permease protein